MKLEEEIEIHEAICNHIHNLFKSKRHDYGSTTEELLRLYGPTSMLTFLRTKLSRLDNLMLGDKKPMHESIKDTLLDLANYSIIWLLEIEKQHITLREQPGQPVANCGGNCKCH